MSNPTKRVKRGQIREIIFDEDARREFLTGFHKRKQQAKAEAARKATAREKQERQDFRREQRRMLRERATENAAQIEKAYGAMGDEEEWIGISDHVEEEAAYEDEQVVATVAVVEDFDPDTIIYGESVSKPPTPAQFTSQSESSSQPRERVHKKPQKVLYQTKDARKAERAKQRARRIEKAELGRAKRSKKRRRL